MRNIIIVSIISSFILIVGCNNQPATPSSNALPEEVKHQEHTLLRDNLAHQEIIILDEPYLAPEEFGQAFGSFYNSYLALQEALVKSDTASANKAAEEMKFVLESISEPDFKKEATEAWENHRKGYLKNLTEFLHVKNLEEKRSYFSHLSEILYCTFKSFELKLDDVYVAFCPMAFDNKGAYWLTDSREIMNPYFGNKMLKCGKIEETIQ